MRTILATLLVALVVVVGLGFYLGWFRVATEQTGQGDQTNVTLQVHKNKIQDDATRLRNAAATATELLTGQNATGQLKEIDVAGKRVTLEPAGKAPMTFMVTEKTRIVRDGLDVMLETLRPGEAAVVMYSEADGKNVARSITVGKS